MQVLIDNLGSFVFVSVVAVGIGYAWIRYNFFV